MEDSRLLDNLVKVVDDDLDEIKSQNSRPGWSPWVLAASIAAASSTAFDEAVKSSPAFADVAFYCLLGRVLYDLCLFLGIANSPAASTDNRRVFKKGSVLSHTRPFLFGGVVAAFIGVPLSIWFAATLASTVLPVAGFYLGQLIIFIALLAISFKKDTLREDADRSGIAWKLVYASLIAGGAFIIYTFVFGLPVPFSAAAIKVGFLIAIISVLLQYLTVSPKLPPQYYELRSLKSDLLLGQIAPALGSFKHKTILSGFLLSDLVLDEALVLVDGQERMASEYELALRHLQPYEEAVDIESLTPDQVAQVAQRLVAAATVGKVTDEIRTSLSSQRDRFQNVLTNAPQANMEDWETMKPLEQLLGSASEHLEKAKTDFEALFNALSKRIGIYVDPNQPALPLFEGSDEKLERM